MFFLYFLFQMLRHFVGIFTLVVLLNDVFGQREQARAEPCDPKSCRLPDCYCGGEDIPGGYSPDQIPQFVLLTFDDAVNGINKEFFSKLFKNRFNPNQCPIKVSISAAILARCLTF